MSDLISVIVPVYNEKKFLARCLDSVLAQTYENFELILVDDGSTDNSGDICEEYARNDNRIVVIHKQNGGLSDARNVGIDWIFANSKSEYLAFIDSDDFVHSRYLELLLKALTEKQSDIAVCERTREMEYDSFFNQDTYSIVEYDKHDFILSTYTGEWSRNIAACFKIFKRFIFQDLRFPVGKRYEDGMTIYKALLTADRISGVNVPLYYWFQNDKSISSQRTDATGLLDREEAIRAHMDYYPYSYNDINEAARRFYLNQMHYMMWDIDYNYVKSSDNLLVKKYLMKQTKKYFRKYKCLCSMDERNKIYEYIYPYEFAVKRKLKLL